MPICSRAVPGDEHWDPQFNWPGTTNVIYGIAVHNGEIYAGGYVSAGSSTNAALEVWDGLQWSKMAIFSGTFGPEIYDIAFVGDTLFVAGSFNAVNGTAITGLAEWDGTSWSSAGLTGSVLALAVDGGKLYAAGAFTNADTGGVVMTNIGYWDGAWHALGSGVGTPGSGSLRAVIVNSGQVYAGGNFTNCGSLLITNLAVWNGSAWSGVGGGIGPALTAIYCLAGNGGDVYAGGIFTQAGTTLATNIAMWDGANWHAVGGGLTGPSGSGVAGLAALNGSICAAGAFTNAGGLRVTNFAVWNGASWSAANGGISSTGNRVVNNGGTSVLVGGNFLTAGNQLMNGIASWDGANWSPIGTAGQINGVASIVRALASDGTNLFAGGSFSYAGRTNAGFIARFDGTNWQSLGPGLNNTVDAIVVTNHCVYAGGLFTGTLGGLSLPYVGLWDGTNWNSLGSAGGLVYALAVGPKGVYGAGTYYTGNAYGSPFFNRWDGTNWNGVLYFTNNTFFAVPLSDSVGYDAIAIQGTNVYLGGNIAGFTQFDPNVLPSTYTNCGNILRFDGTWGWIMETGLNGTNFALAVIGTNVFAAGPFTIAGGVSANQIAQWNGYAWSSVGGSVVGSGTVLALTTIGNTLYAGGTFTNMGGVSANHIAKWDGTSWSALGSGAVIPGTANSGPVYSLAAAGNDLYAGGTFRMAGNRGSFDLAHWNDGNNYYTPQIGPLAVTNGEFRMRLFGTGGLTNIIQATTNFSVWTPVLTNTAGIYDFTDPNASSYPRRFYRASLGP